MTKNAVYLITILTEHLDCFQCHTNVCIHCIALIDYISITKLWA